MNKLRKSTRNSNRRILTFAATGLLGAAVMLTNPGSVSGQNQEVPTPVKVLVTNKPEAPVPVNGTVKVSNTESNPVSVQVVNQSDAPATVTGTISVKNDGNGLLLVRDADNPARQPFSFEPFTTLEDGNRHATNTFQVPAGKRLVIEQVSVFVPDSLNNSANNLRVDVDTTAIFESGQAPVRFVYSIPGVAVAGGWIASSQMRSYAAAGSIVSISVWRSTTTGLLRPQIYASGYLIDLP